jgi:hypothetical protein
MVDSDTDDVLSTMVAEQLSAMGISAEEDPEIAAAIRASLADAMRANNSNGEGNNNNQGNNGNGVGVGNGNAMNDDLNGDDEDNRFADFGAYSCPICHARMDAWELDAHLDTCAGE